MRMQRRRRIVQGVILGVMLLGTACGSRASNDPQAEIRAERGATDVVATLVPPTLAPATELAQPVATEAVLTETSASAATEVDFAPLVALIESEMAAQQVPGLAVAVVRNGEIIFGQGFGVADVATDRAVTAATSFRIGSITKPLTAIALMQLVEAGEVDLDVPVVRYLPEFQVNNQITVRQLLSHSSGLGDAAIPYGRTDLAALQDYVASLLPASAFAPPGTLWERPTRYALPASTRLPNHVEMHRQQHASLSTPGEKPGEQNEYTDSNIRSRDQCL